MDAVDVDHVAIRVTDLERALGFHHDLLGLPVRDRERFDEGAVPYVAVIAGAGTFTSYRPTRTRSTSAENTCAFWSGQTTSIPGASSTNC